MTSWQIDGAAVTVDPESIVLTPRQLTLGFEISRADIDDWRPYGRVGDINVEDGYAGTFRVLDRAGRDGATTVTPPDEDQPPLDTATWWPQSYNEEQLSPDRYEVTLVFARLSNRGDEFDVIDEVGAGEWEIETERGTVGLDEVAVAHIPRDGSTTKSRPELELVLSADQAAALVDAWSHPGGVVTEQPPDGPNDLRDESPDGRQRIVLSSPNGATVGGVYYVLDWELSLKSFGPRRWQMSVQLGTPTSIPETGATTARVTTRTAARRTTAQASVRATSTTSATESGQTTARASTRAVATGRVTARASTRGQEVVEDVALADDLAAQGLPIEEIAAISRIDHGRAEDLKKTHER